MPYHPYNSSLIEQDRGAQPIIPIAALISPYRLMQQYSLNPVVRETLQQAQASVHAILNGQDRRLVVVIGPCSVHDVEATLDYAQRLNALRQRYQQRLLIIMRTYFEKPRTITGWKGFLYDPQRDGSARIEQGLTLARRLLLQINQLGLPTATEFLESLAGRYLSDLIAWGAIGARTVESQQHREMASALSCPVGFKNSTEGNIQVAIDAIHAARTPQTWLTQSIHGEVTLYRTPGNPLTHLILRGGRTPNYQASDVRAACHALRARALPERLMIDCSHSNCQKNYQRQLAVGDAVCQQIRTGTVAIMGVMIESFLMAGNQPATANHPLNYGQSITDPCLNWQDSEMLLAQLADAVDSRF